VLPGVSNKHVAFTFTGSRSRKKGILHGFDLEPLKMKKKFLRNVENHYLQGFKVLQKLHSS
jgi:hypothetical protein